ncbi:uncharacterized protein G6M90_00g078290 [Metarhizium brunneum]|uniref:Uncharacterized protein n=1 Tax=Metarhizium brunneum TaxID=500148 RepID=A0A7D5UZA2_9HYPO
MSYAPLDMLTAQEGKPSIYALRSLGYEVELSSTAVDDVVAEGVDESKVVPLQSWTTLAMAKMHGETRGFIPAVRARRRKYQKQICRAVRVVPVGEFSVLLSLNRPDMPTTSCCSHAANIRPDSFPTLTGPWDISHNKGDSAEARGYAIVCRFAWSRGKGILSFTWPGQGALWWHQVAPGGQTGSQGIHPRKLSQDQFGKA